MPLSKTSTQTAVSTLDLRIIPGYIYSDQVQLGSAAEARNLCYAAKKYLLPHLVTKCIEFLSNHLTPENVCEAFEFGCQMDAKPFQERCLQVMRAGTQVILTQSSFLAIKQSTLTALLHQSSLSVESELDLVDATLAWARAEAGRRGLTTDSDGLKEALGPALANLRLLALTPQQFATRVATSGLFSVEETHAILLRLLGNQSVQLPEGVGSMSRARTCLSAPVFTSREQVCACPTGIGELALLRLSDPPNRTKESRVTMRCDKDIKLHGLQIGAQVNFPMALQAFCSTYVLSEFLRKSYLEEVWVQLVVTEYRLGRFNRWTAEDIYLNAEVNHNSTIELRFREPVAVKRFDQVELRISYFKEGIYPKGAWQAVAPCGVANFSFESANPNHECVLNFISSIIFTLDDQK